ETISRGVPQAEGVPGEGTRHYAKTAASAKCASSGNGSGCDWPVVAAARAPPSRSMPSNGRNSSRKLHRLGPRLDLPGKNEKERGRHLPPRLAPPSGKAGGKSVVD